jgi:restriction system protein
VSVPSYQDLMVPVLSVVSDGQSWTRRELREAVAKELGLTEEERAERYGSGSRRYDGRLNWAVTYLRQAGLLERAGRGVERITDRGREMHRRHPNRMDNAVLAQFPEFRMWVNGSARGKTRPQDSQTGESTATPEDALEQAVRQAHDAVAAALLERIRDQEPEFLERLVLRLLTAMGYGSAGTQEHLGGSGDGGVDGMISQDPLGLERIYVQAKRYAEDRTVRRPEVHGFVGALAQKQANRGVFITTSRFSEGARQCAEQVPASVVLIDGPLLAQLMIDHGVGVQVQQSYVLKRVDEDFFDEL